MNRSSSLHRMPRRHRVQILARVEPFQIRLPVPLGSPTPLHHRLGPDQLSIATDGTEFPVLNKTGASCGPCGSEPAHNMVHMAETGEWETLREEVHAFIQIRPTATPTCGESV